MIQVGRNWLRALPGGFATFISPILAQRKTPSPKLFHVGRRSVCLIQVGRKWIRALPGGFATFISTILAQRKTPPPNLFHVGGRRVCLIQAGRKWVRALPGQPTVILQSVGYSTITSPMLSACTKPFSGFFTDRMWPCTVASTSLFSKLRSVFSMVQLISFRPLQ